MSFKSRVMMPLQGLTILIALTGLVMFIVRQGAIEWLGVFLASGALPVYLSVFVALRKAARTTATLPAVQIAAALGLALALWPVLSRPASTAPTAYLPLSLALIGYLAMQWYVFVYSRYGRKPSAAIVLGQKLPDISFTTLDGQSVSVSDLGGRKALLVFYRANWCALCMGQLSEVRERADALAGVQVKFISNQGGDRSRELADKLDLPDHMEVLLDPELGAAKALGIADLGGTPLGMIGYPADTVMASVIALDENGQVIFGHQTDNYRVRPHPDAFMPVLVG
ncbi:MAG: redoxin domain-containing protein [Pseudomonadota bacterium]